MTISTALESADQAEVIDLVQQSDALSASLYPAESNHLVDLATLTRPNVRFVVARRAGRIVGCAALMIVGDGSGELKRMFVDPSARGLGIGHRLIGAIEAIARDEAVGVLRLETGIYQPPAISLYHCHGFQDRGPFGDYVDDPLSIFMEKRLPAHADASA